jgi:phosphoglycerate dehydrogenase-like enzyme
MNRLQIYVDMEMEPEVLHWLKEETAGHDLILAEPAGSSADSGPELDARLEAADIAFGQPDPTAIAGSRSLKWIQISSSGITRYDTAEFRSLMTARKVDVTNSARVFYEACAVHALSFMLAQARHLPKALARSVGNFNSRSMELRRASGTLRGETILLVGYGAIGRRLSELLQPFGMKILAFRRRPSGDESVMMVAEDQLGHALGIADHIMDILPESSSTRRFFDEHRFAAMKPGAVFYNIGRGATVDQAALSAALHSGQLSAAWLDVTVPEPLPEGHPLLATPNCFITPHTAGGHRNEFRSIVRHFLENLGRFTRGEPLIDRVM